MSSDSIKLTYQLALIIADVIYPEILDRIVKILQIPIKFLSSPMVSEFKQSNS